MTAPCPGQDALSIDEFLAALAAPERGVRAVMVHKLRRHYTVNGCRSEVAEVVAEGVTTRTLAIEATDAAKVSAQSGSWGSPAVRTSRTRAG